MSEKMVRKIDLKLSTDKLEYLLGEPVIAYIQIINSGSEPISIIAQIDPKYDYLNFYIKKEISKEILFVPYVVADSIIQTSILEPGKSITKDIKIFYGGNGWTFESAGKYQIRCVYKGTTENLGESIGSNVVEINVLPTKSEQEKEQVNLMMGEEQGKFLLFESGDHLTYGISSLLELINKFPESQLANYANFALGKNFAIDFKDFQKGRIRKAEIEKSIEHLNKTKDKEIGSYFKKETFFTLADLFRKSNNFPAAKKTLDEFIEISSNDPKLSNSINKAKSILDEIK
jgi:hypothetical protein